MTVEEIVKECLPQVKIMQLATSVDNQPWACNLHYYSDEQLNLYWLSTQDRRHSEEITHNSKVAATIMVHMNTEQERYLIGISCEGKAELADKSSYEIIADGFNKKHGTPESFLSSVKDGSNPHVFYRLNPTKFVLFDTKNFPKDPRQEWEVKNNA